MGFGVCQMCKGPTNRTKLALYCKRCAMDRSNVRRRETYTGKPSRPCDDCQALLPQGSRAIFCAECRARREKEYRRTPRYRAQQVKYRSSPRGKMTEAKRLERNREFRLAQMRAYNRAHKAPPPIVKCATLLCENRFPRSMKQARLKFCRDCALIFFGPAKVRRRAA